jgi:hypothetical protein
MKRDLNAEHLNLPFQSKRQLSFFEFWPSWLFYFPIKAYAALLMLRYRSFTLPTVANPYLAGGAFCGDAKSEILGDIQKYLSPYASPFVVIDRKQLHASNEAEQISQLAKQANIAFPFVAKPEFGCRGAGVQLVESKENLEQYLVNYPKDERFILHELIPYEHEAGVFYCRLPGQERGRVISLTLKYFPKVLGDGKKTLKELIEADPRASQIKSIYFDRHVKALETVIGDGISYSLVFAGNHSKGTIFKDGEQLITPELEETFDCISKQLPEFYFGRFDVRFHDFEGLTKGQNMKIVEINGAGAESTHVWDSDCTIFKAYRDIFKQFDYLFLISANNKARGFKPQSFKMFYDAMKRDERLSSQYPGTD